MKSLYFLGIGGSAMGAVAGALATMGYRVSGSDANVYPPMSDFLEEQGISYYKGYTSENLTHFAPDVLVVGNATGRGNPEVEYALNEHMPMYSMSEVVRRYLIRRGQSVVVAGTHGKTTTTSLCAWLLESVGRQPGFLIGGIPGNFNYGCRPAGSETGVFVSEGDEYDSAFFDKRSKFVHYRPDIAIVNNVEFDHADIFDSLAEVERSFRHFVRLIPGRGLLLAAEYPAVQRLRDEAYCTVESFGAGPKAHWRFVEPDYSDTGASFKLLCGKEDLGRFTLALSGEHNVRNAVAATAAAIRCGLSAEQVRAGLRSFKAPKRRMEVLGQWRDCTLIDDFAHHPTAIRSTLEAVLHTYPGRRILACFEPRSNTTTRNIFQAELAASFGPADLIVLGAINRPERYTEAERLNSAALQQTLQKQGKVVRVIGLQEGTVPEWGQFVLDFLREQARPHDVILLLSNGNFGGLRQMLTAEGLY